MTPFDVLKTRLQTVQPTVRVPAPAVPAECCQTVVLPARLSGAAAVAAGGECATSVIPGAPRPGPSSRHVVLAAPTGCYHPSKWAGIWGESEATALGTIALRRNGAADVAAGAAVLAPERERGFWGEVAAVRRETGVRGLWKGVGTTL